MLKPKKIPLRRCTGCMEMKDKRRMIRIVRTDENVFFLDFTGKKSGRGAYVCPDMDCFTKAYKQKGLEKSFKQAVPHEVYEHLKEELTSRLSN